MEDKPTFDKYGEKAIELIAQGQSLFITGKAGTGKTTLLRHIKNTSKRRVAVLASTGIAAKNAIGITIHSFLRLPTTPYFPGIKNNHLFALGRNDIEMVKSVEVIIVDEVSMVRCDVLDAMDEVLRHYRGCDSLFGGVQMVFFGDLYQLMPVAPTEDWEQLKKYYKSPYFFSSKAFEAMDCPMLELKKVHRQKDDDFIRLLNHVRDGKSLSSEIQLINTRFKANYKPSLHGDHIVLTTHNRKAKGINWGMLERLDSKLREYTATKSGWFPKDEYPTDYYLQLKRGARVMFVRNDTSGAAEYVNGTLGVVKDFAQSYVVIVTDDNRKIFVRPQRWEHQRYKINKITKQLETEITGYFIQYPLKLAWAVTIHKSQGMTFDNVVIDAQRAFTYGQVYVALSRCRTLGGIILMTELTPKTIKADEVVKQFMASVKRVEVEDSEEEEVTVDRHLTFRRPEDRTLFLVNNGMSIDDIAETSDLKKGVVYSHLTKLAAEGKIDAHHFIRPEIFSRLHAIYLSFDTDIDRHEVKEMMPLANYGEIELVRAYVARELELTGTSNVTVYTPDLKPKLKANTTPKTEEIKKRVKTKPSASATPSTPKTKAEAVCEKNVGFALSSKWFFDDMCRVVCNRRSGYFVNIYRTKSFVKIKDLNGLTPTGSIWIKRPNQQGWSEIVHAVSSDQQRTVGYIKQAGGGLAFKENLTQPSFLRIKTK